MKFNPAALSGLALLALAVGGASLTACSTDAKTDQAEAKSDDKGGPGVGGPQLGTPGGGPVNDKSGDTTLQRMIAEVVPQFRQLEFVDGETGDTIHYNLFVPKDINPAKTYPLVLFMADASTPGTDVTRPLTQGYGALVWATASSQAQNPSYVLVPQFSGVAVNDAYERTPQVDAIIRLLNSVVADNNVDVNRLRKYPTGAASLLTQGLVFR